MPLTAHPSPTRRGVLAAGGAAGLGALLAACGATSGVLAADGAAASSGGWSFTDDRKTTVRLAASPRRVVAYIGTAAALYDFGVAESRLVGVFGPTRLANGRPDVLAGDLDIARTTIIGNAYGQFDIERYAALQPQLLVTGMWEPGALWYVPADSEKQILELAPAVGLTVAGTTLTAALSRHADLAAALGADLTSRQATAAKTRFEQAAEALRAAVKRNGGIRVLAGSAAPDLFYVADPRVYADLGYYRRLGVDLVVPARVSGGFFESLSWENVATYPADLILLDDRSSALQPSQLTAKPTWTRLPAVAANQITPWLSEPRLSYPGCAPLIETLAAAVSRAKKVT